MEAYVEEYAIYKGRGYVKKQAELIKKLTDRELLLNLYVTQITMLIVAVLISWLLGDPLISLKYVYFHWDHVLIGLVFGFVVVIIELFLYKNIPRKWFDDGGINERVFSHLHPLHIGVLSMVVAISEEVLFRGVIQSQFGIWISSLLFALVHLRYLSNSFLFSITLGLSFSLGGLFLVTENLFAVIIAHFVIDFILGLLIRKQKRDDAKETFH